MATKQFLISKYLVNFKRHFSSALYIIGEKASSMCVIVKPILDFEERLENRLELEQNLKLRRLNINLEKLERKWAFYKHLDEQKNILEQSRNEIYKQLKDKEKEDQVNTLQLHSKLVRDDLKVLKEYMCDIEESAAINVLSLPNVLHKNTPTDIEVVIHTFLDKPNNNSKSHLDIGKENDFIEFSNSMFYYLKNDAALFELSVVNFVNDTLLNSSMQQFSNCDFCKSAIVEGCGTDFYNSLNVFTLENIHSDATSFDYNRLHLSGGASLYAFMAHFTKYSVQESYFPLKLFTSGRKYHPIRPDHSNLFNVSQETVVETFIATIDDQESLNNQFEEAVKIIIKIYEMLGYHFRLVYLPANELKNYESLRLSIQMFSCYLQQYVEVGHCSICDSYLSKRLLFNYSVKKTWRFPKIISGTFLRVPSLLACVLEYNQVSNINNLLQNVPKEYTLLQ